MLVLYSIEDEVYDLGFVSSLFNDNASYKSLVQGFLYLI